jgi:hypothetical protein
MYLGKTNQGLQLSRAVAKSTRRRRRAAGLVVVLGVAAVVGLSVVEVSGALTGIKSSQAARSRPKSTAPPPGEPRGGRSLFPSHRIIAFYGAADSSVLGVLGDASPEQLWPRLAAQASAYGSPGTTALPAFELITYLAQAAPGRDGSYSLRVSDRTIERYLAAVRAHDGLLILDVQPGRGDFLADAQSLRPWLDQPDVALALDPEWQLGPSQLPDRQIGHTAASEINRVSEWLAGVVRAGNLPEKLLLIHQFTAGMVRDKALLRSQPGVATVFNMDGLGSRAAKMSKYALLRSDPRFPLGFKLFYRQDQRMFSPQELMTFQPVPSVIEYE